MLKDPFGPPLIFRYATVLSSLAVARVDAEQGKAPPREILDLLMSCVIDLAREADVDTTALKEEVKNILLNPHGAVDEAQSYGAAYNKIPI